VVSLWGRPWSRPELLARVGRLDQVGGVQLAEAADGAERGVRLLRFSTGSGFGRIAGQAQQLAALAAAETR
jgi:hypothetical protein